ncbi:NAD(P)-binding protein [Linderina pennispora]|uniref:NAD(P)-binding protein n=1 Tax=Linderina pennispora TaxID=61395 RepID=A0A1Y1W752_9FUNG|nr:NAD(P)-binding protein [Linderina pennispora]ORX69361.1 NAD(P)-binding protein [Linderina pennispora]
MTQASPSLPVKVAIVGCGNRGTIYSTYAQQSSRMQVVQLASRSSVRLRSLAKKLSLDDSSCYSSWEDLLNAPKIADAVLICVIDRLHKEVAVAFANKGYHILLEKPMATEIDDCKEVYDAVRRNNIILGVSHVLRYTAYNQKIKEIIDSGALGDIAGIQHMEPVGHYHFAHSYVRGNWRKEAESSFSLMSKSCHDIDILLYFLGDKAQCTKVSSFGGLSHFTKDKKPAEAQGATKCLDCPHEQNCAYSAKKIYLEPIEKGHTGWPVDGITDIVDIENVHKALAAGPYGRCVYECDNDVCDNQVVNMEFTGNKYVSFSMVAFTEEICVRKTRIFGSKGELVGDGNESIEVYDFLTGQKTKHTPQLVTGSLAGHGGGDMGVITAFVDAVAHNNQSFMSSDALNSLDSYLVVFAAEEARRQGKVVNLDEFRKQHNITII